MSYFFEIPIASLSHDGDIKLEECVEVSALDLKDSEVMFISPLKLNGKAYLADNHIIIAVDAEIDIALSCTICNGDAKKTIVLENHYITKPLAEIKEPKFNYFDDLRQAIFLEVPPYLECEGGQCPKREELKPYYKTTSQAKETSTETYYPFGNLDKHLKKEG